MSLPRFPHKYGHSGVFDPRDLLKYLSRDKQEAWPGFETCILLYHQAPWQKLKSQGVFSQSNWLGLQFLWQGNERTAVVTGLGLGAPALAMKLEEMIALGVKNFVLLGTAGALSRELGPGSTVVATKAVRDEGVSHHYLPSEESAEACAELTEWTSAQLFKAGLEPKKVVTWTTDAIYRETAVECDHYLREGVDTVEMEVAALFAVSRFRKVRSSAVLVVSDYVGAEGWQPFLRDVKVKDSLYRSLTALYEKRPGPNFLGDVR